MSDDHVPLTIWVVYDHPKDFPDKWVLRPQRARRDGTIEAGPAFLADTLDEIRALVPPFLHRLPRFPDDDPVIAETWI